MKNKEDIPFCIKFEKEIDYAINEKIDKDSIPVDMKKFNRSQWQTVMGKRFGRLQVLSFAGTASTKNRWRSKWNCICDCGNKSTVPGDSLLAGLTRSCGCLEAESSRRLVESCNKPVEYKGIRYNSLCALAEKLGIKDRALRSRILRGHVLDAPLQLGAAKTKLPKETEFRYLDNP